MEEKKYLEQAQELCQIEAEAILQMAQKLDEQFITAVKTILACQGRVIITGMGKSGLVGRKIAATLASTGTPAFFLHPAEGIHGDLGMVTGQDVVIAISNSGETEEIVHILPVLKRLGSTLIALTGKVDSTLAKNSEIVLDIGVEKEACPLGLAPTASTTATLAMGDALAVVLLQARDFQPEDFAIFHPGGSLGRRLLLTVADLMHQGEENPWLEQGKTVKEALFKITEKKLGAVNVVDGQGNLVGIVTDGDIRRHLEKDEQLLGKKVEAVMTAQPKTILPTKLAAQALKLMQDKSITVLPVIDGQGQLVGTIHLHDLLKAGLV